MANEEHVELLKQGATVWNAWRREHRLEIRPELDGADLNGFDLSNAFLDYAVLSNAELNDTNLHRAKLMGTDLNCSKFCGANLSEAGLAYVNLSGADLSGADLSGALLSNAILNAVRLDGTKWHGVRVGYTVFARLDLRVVEELDTVIHLSPSKVDILSVQLPEGETRRHFLRGVGFPDILIDYLPSLLTSAIQYESCFISYAHQDEALAKRLYKDLQDKGVRCWYAPEDLKIGDRIRSRIDQAIQVQEKLLLLLSEHSLASSWVEFEVEAALEREQRQGCDVLFPVRLDDAVIQTTQAWAATLRRMRHIGDFTNWQDGMIYQQRFEELLRHLKIKTL
jgi:hypothetical protein